MSYKHILVAVDESPMSYAAVEQALELAKDLNSRNAHERDCSRSICRSRLL